MEGNEKNRLLPKNSFSPRNQEKDLPYSIVKQSQRARECVWRHAVVKQQHVERSTVLGSLKQETWAPRYSVIYGESCLSMFFLRRLPAPF